MRKNKIKKKEKLKEALAKKEAKKKLIQQLLPLIIAMVLWFITLGVLHLPSIKDVALNFFVKFTLDTAIGFGRILQIPMSSNRFPYITVDGFTMQIIMECTAYNFYIFVIYLSLLSPVNWKQRIYTLIIFLSAIFIINNFRFITMGFIGRTSPQLFNYIHDYLWNILFGFMVFLIWLWRYNTNIKSEKI